jgi:hypothetical protein
VKWTERAAKLAFENYMLIAFEDDMYELLRTRNVTGVAFVAGKEARNAAPEVHQDCSLRRNDVIQQLLRFGIVTHVIIDDDFMWTSSVLPPLTPGCDVAVPASDTPTSSFTSLVSVRPNDGGRAFWGAFRRCVIIDTTAADVCRCLQETLSRTERACLTTDGGEPYIPGATRLAAGACNSAASDGG